MMARSDEREPLIAGPSSNDEYDAFENTGNNRAMGGLGVSQDQLVEPVDNAKKTFQYIAALSATLGALAAGSMLGWSSPVGPKILSNETTYDFPVDEADFDWISSLVNLGAAAICFPIGLIMDKMGRRTTMLLLVIPFTIGWGLITWAKNAVMLMIGRVLTGMAGGAFCVTAPTYTSEIAQDSIRGTLGSYFQLMITIGILFAYAVGAYTPIFYFNLLCACIPLIFGAVFFFMPESPSFLVKQRKHDEARQALVRLRGPVYDVDYELNKLKRSAEDAQNNPVSFMSAITKKTAIKAIIICFALMFFQQLSGINAVIFNTTAIFDSAGVSMDSKVSAIFIGVIQVVATFISTVIVDRLGRRVLLLFSALLMCLCTTTLGVFFFLKEIHGGESEIVKSIGWLPLVSLSLFIIAFSVGFGPIPWIMAGELCQIDIKAFVGSTAGTFNWLLSFGVTRLFNVLKTAMGDGQVFWLFAAIMLVAFVFIFFIVPETKGKSVDEVQRLLAGNQQQQQTPDPEKI